MGPNQESKWGRYCMLDQEKVYRTNGKYQTVRRSGKCCSVARGEVLVPARVRQELEEGCLLGSRVGLGGSPVLRSTGE